nr:MAG TPA: hypothetical protein [Caudoviricetes sp.]
MSRPPERSARMSCPAIDATQGIGKSETISSQASSRAGSAAARRRCA